MIFVLMFSVVFMFCLQTEIAAQDTNFKPREKIDYRETDSSTEWKEGVVVKIYPGNTQLLIRSKPDQWFKDGLEQAIAISRICRIENRPADNSTTKANVVEKKADNLKREADKTDGKGLMTKEEIIAYLKTRVGTDGPHPKKEQVSKELVEIIKRRGVDFRFPPNERLEVIKAGGNDSTFDVQTAIEQNYGQPTPSSWLQGKWNMIIIGATVDYAPGDGKVYRQNEAAARAGFLTISKDKTYQSIHTTSAITSLSQTYRPEVRGEPDADN